MHVPSEELLMYSEKSGQILYKEKGFSLPKTINKKNLNFFLIVLSLIMLNLELG